jgi:hypothetical protein
VRGVVVRGEGGGPGQSHRHHHHHHQGWSVRAWGEGVWGGGGVMGWW